MIFFKIFHDFSPQATPKFAAGEKNSPQATSPFAAGEENSPQAKHTHSPPGETLYRFSRYQSMVSAMPRAKSYCGS